MDEQGSNTVNVIEEMAKREDLKHGGVVVKIGTTFGWNWDDTIANFFKKLFRKGEKK
jgi:hypothetical protein